MGLKLARKVCMASASFVKFLININYLRCWLTINEQGRENSATLSDLIWTDINWTLEGLAFIYVRSDKVRPFKVRPIKSPLNFFQSYSKNKSHSEDFRGLFLVYNSGCDFILILLYMYTLYIVYVYIYIYM